jgi:hypothetical protein
MNKSLLLIICDFLLISILALVDFEPAPTDPPPLDQVLQQSAGDLVEVLKLSLENEADRNRALDSSLEATRASLADTSRDLLQTRTSLESRAAELETTRQDLVATRTDLELTAAERERVARELAERQQQAAALQAELRERQQSLAAAQSTLASLEQAQREQAVRETRLETELRVRETESALLEQNLTAARAEVERARIEAEVARQRADRLAEGVAQLAQSSTALGDEIRTTQAELQAARELSVNAVFQRFASSRVSVVTTVRGTASGARDRTLTATGLLVRSNDATWAILNAAAIGMDPGDLDRVQGVTAQMQVGNRTLAVERIGYLADDVRLAIIPMPDAVADLPGVQVLQLAADPLQFPDAVLIDQRGTAYSEFPVRIPAGENGYLSVESGTLRRLLGDFAPSRGDFVMSKGGDLLGVMVSNSRVRSLGPLWLFADLKTGDQFSIEQARTLKRLMQP